MFIKEQQNRVQNAYMSNMVLHKYCICVVFYGVCSHSVLFQSQMAATVRF